VKPHNLRNEGVSTQVAADDVEPAAAAATSDGGAISLSGFDIYSGTWKTVTATPQFGGGASE
jgi:hypothetical protein